MVLKKTLINLQKKLFQLLIFLLPTQLAIHFWPDWAHVFGIRVDYLAPAIYLTDIFIILILTLRSIEIFFFNPSLIKKKRIIKNINNKNIFFLIGVVLFAILNIYFSSYFEASLIKWIKIGELALFCIYIVKSKNLDKETWIFKPLGVSLVFFSLIAIVQLFIQRTIGGLFYYLGERSFSVSTSGIALSNIFGKEIMRVYSTFSHPNSLAGYYLVAGICILLGNLNLKKKNIFKFTELIFITIVLLISFSLGAWISSIVCFLFFLLKENKKLFGLLSKSFLGLLIIVSLLLIPFSKEYVDTQTNLSEGVFRRLELIKASGFMLTENTLFGIGLNNFIQVLPNTKIQPYISWWLQPVHNIFILCLTETGIIGLLLFGYLIFYAINKSLKTKRKKYLVIAVVAILITGFFDHYWLTLQQNQLLFSLVLGLSLKRSNS